MKTQRCIVCLKRVIAAIFCLCQFFVCGCSAELRSAILNSVNTPMFLPSESQAHFAKLEQSLMNVARSFDLELKKTRDEYDDGGIIIDYEIKLGENSRIKISLSNLLLDGRKKGEERFGISYQKHDRTADFDVRLFTALVNSVSGRAVTKAFCEQLINDTDGSFSEISTNGSGWLHKFRYLDSSGRWSISEELAMDESKMPVGSGCDYTELLYFEGATASGN